MKIEKRTVFYTAGVLVTGIGIGAVSVDYSRYSESVGSNIDSAMRAGLKLYTREDCPDRLEGKSTLLTANDNLGIFKGAGVLLFQANKSPDGGVDITATGLGNFAGSFRNWYERHYSGVNCRRHPNVY